MRISVPHKIFSGKCKANTGNTDGLQTIRTMDPLLFCYILLELLYDNSITRNGLNIHSCLRIEGSLRIQDQIFRGHFHFIFLKPRCNWRIVSQLLAEAQTVDIWLHRFRTIAQNGWSNYLLFVHSRVHITDSVEQNRSSSISSLESHAYFSFVL